MEEITRIDQWLWAARFFKTRGLASDAVAGGLVHVNAMRVKPAKTVKLGDILQIQRDQQFMVVVIRALPCRRGPAKEAVLLYEETPESVEERQRIQSLPTATMIPVLGGRPTKK
ncbi:MAG TPA: RNA-binding protein, partial [Alphaproteobacteria bacterium]|nr:RNA-binding protein [Alphaproteobacteria bacterium]